MFASHSETRVSAIIPTFQGASYIGETLASIAAQTMPISQLIISDDSSTDKTREIIAEFIAISDIPSIVLEHTPSGPTKNYLNAAKHADGDLVIVADQDDIWMPNKVELILAAFVDEKVALVCHDSSLVDTDLNFSGKTLRGGRAASRRLSTKINSANDKLNFQIFLRGGLPLLAHTLSFRKEILPLIEKKPTEIEEWWFEEWLSCVAMTQGRLYFIAEALVKYRQHTEQTSGGFINQKPGIQNATNRKYQARIDKLEFCRNLISKQSNQRLVQVDSYVSFLSARQAIVSEKSQIKALFALLNHFLIGNYFIHAKGFQSAVLDLLLVLKLKS